MSSTPTSLPPAPSGAVADGMVRPRCWPVVAASAGAALGLAGLAWQTAVLDAGSPWLSGALGLAAAVLPLWLGRQLWRESNVVAGQAQHLRQQSNRLQALGRSEERLRLAEQVAQLGSFDWDPNSGALHWSDQHFRLWGHAPGALQPDYAAFRARIHPDDLGALELRLRHALQTGGRYEFNHRVCWPDGTLREVLARGDVSRDGSGRALRMVGTVQDITDRRAAERRLQLHEFALNAIADPVSVIDEHRVYQLVNQAWCRATGLRPDDVVGLSPGALQQQVASAERDAALQRCVAGGQTEVVLAALDLAGSGRRWWETTMFPFSDPRGGAQRAAALVSRDVTARHDAAQALASSIDQLRLTLNTTGDAIFASDAGGPHEPLLFVNHRMLQLWGIPPAQAARLTPAGLMAAARPFFIDPEREIARVHEVIASGTLQEDRLTLNDGRVLLRRCIPTTLAGRQVRVWGFRDITIEARALAGLRAAEAQQRALLAAFPGYIACISAEQRFTHVNARLAALLETTPQALIGQPVTATIGAENGPQLAHRIARALDGEVLSFEHLHAATSSRPALPVRVTLARGLDRHTGLYQCYAFGTDITPQQPAEAGRLAAAAKPPRPGGDAPSVPPLPPLPPVLPRPAVTAATGTSPAAAPTAQAAAAPPGAPLRVLYIDDNPVNTLLMAAMFERLPGLLLRCESDPHQGLVLALADPPALLLVDIQMPGMDGYQLLRRLRADPATRDVPAIAVSANAMPQDLVRGRAAGFADYLTKPLDLHRLQVALQAVLPGWSAPG